MANIAIQTLVDAYNMAFDLSRFYTSRLKGADAYKTWSVNGHLLNSIAWINAHLCWTEDFLLLQALGAPSTGIEWLNHYSMGSSGTLHESTPDMKSILNDRKIIHAAALEHLGRLDDEDLNRKNSLGITFGDSNSCKNIIMHAIRHEATHAGHLGWLCKINGIQTV